MDHLPFILDTVLRLLSGIPLTLQLAASSVALGALLGLFLALMRLSGAALCVGLAWAYVQLIRSVPLLVLIFLIYYGLGQFGAVRGDMGCDAGQRRGCG